MGRNGKEHLGTFAQQRKDGKAFLQALRRAYAPQSAHPLVPEFTNADFTPQIMARAEELWQLEQAKPVLQRRSRQTLMLQLVRGEIT